MTTTGLDPRYDDANNPDWYCVHGQYTGSPWGADFLYRWHFLELRASRRCYRAIARIR